MLRCNIRFIDLPFKLPVSNIWHDIWDSWCNINYQENLTSMDEVCNQTIWFNSHIKLGNKVAFLSRWSSNNIMWIQDLLTGEGPYRFLTLQELERKYEMRIPFTEYYGIIKAIPEQWKQILSNPETDSIDSKEDYKLIDRIDDCPKPSRILYKMLLKKKFKPPINKARKWSEELNTQIQVEEFVEGLESGRTSTINSRLRSFNYNFHMRNVPYESRLHKMGIKPSELCMHCNQKESLLHLYWTCPLSRRLWERLKEEIMKHLGLDITLIASECLLNTNIKTTYKKMDTRRSVRIMYLLCKYYIHLSKCTEEERSPYGLIGYIMKAYNMEHKICQQKGSLKLISVDWSNLARSWRKRNTNYIGNTPRQGVNKS